VQASFKQLKILAIKFKYLGDVAVMIPSLRALRQSFPTAELHVLVAEEAAAIVENLPWIDRIWKLPRVRGRLVLSKSWPILKELRAERFDRSVDFVGNDRGAILSLIIGAERRLGLESEKGFFGRVRCYHETVKPLPRGVYEPERDFSVLKPWNIPRPSSFAMEMKSDPALDSKAAPLMPQPAVLCHLSTSQPKKEWPIRYWVELFEKAEQAGVIMIFSSGSTLRERALLDELKNKNPAAPTLPIFGSLAEFLAVLNRSAIFVGGDTGPLHFAAALGKPTLALFGPSLRKQWAPQGNGHVCLVAPNPCLCSVHASACTRAPSCMESIEVEKVWNHLKTLLDQSTSSTSLNL